MTKLAYRHRARPDLEPFVTNMQELDLASPLGPQSRAAKRTGLPAAGMPLVQPGGVSISVSGDVLYLGAPAPPDLRGQLQLKVPLRKARRLQVRIGACNVP